MTASRQLDAPRYRSKFSVGHRAIRRLLRHEWQTNIATAQAIQAAATQLLSDPAQVALAEQQIQAT